MTAGESHLDRVRELLDSDDVKAARRKLEELIRQGDETEKKGEGLVLSRHRYFGRKRKD